MDEDKWYPKIDKQPHLLNWQQFSSCSIYPKRFLTSSIPSSLRTTLHLFMAQLIIIITAVVGKIRGGGTKINPCSVEKRDLNWGRNIGKLKLSATAN